MISPNAIQKLDSSLHSILFAAETEQLHALTADLWEYGTAGIIEEDACRLRAFFDDDSETAELTRKYTVLDVRHEEPLDPACFSREGWDPILVGEKFLIAPSWIEQPTPAGRLRLSIDDTTAFGTGRHESTQLMLRTMERELKPDDTVLDVGSGSGILSAAAVMLGAQKVFSCDLHTDSIAAAYGRFSLPSFVGSADAVRGNVVDLLLANISAKVIDALAFDLKRVVKPGGRILLAGFIRSKIPQRLNPQAVWQQGEWLCWLCRPEDIESSASNDPRQGQLHSPDWW